MAKEVRSRRIPVEVVDAVQPIRDRVEALTGVRIHPARILMEAVRLSQDKLEAHLLALPIGDLREPGPETRDKDQFSLWGERVE